MHIGLTDFLHVLIFSAHCCK